MQLSSFDTPHSRHAAHGWQDLMQVISPDAQLCLLVQPVDLKAQVCSTSTRDSSSQDAEVPALQGASVLVKGSTGDCCEEASPSHPNPSHHDDPAHHSAQAAAKRVAETPDAQIDGVYAARYGLEVRYFGLVSQSASYAQTDGCYLIKTVQQADRSACRCMHYSLMRVAQGSALAEQAMGFWQV